MITLTERECDTHCQRLGLSATAQSVVKLIRQAHPSRRVQGRRGNVCALYPCQKMGVTIQAESYAVELAGVYEMEHDPDVLKFYDQLPPFKLKYFSRGGKPVGVVQGTQLDQPRSCALSCARRPLPCGSGAAGACPVSMCPRPP